MTVDDIPGPIRIAQIITIIVGIFMVGHSIALLIEVRTVAGLTGLSTVGLQNGLRVLQFSAWIFLLLGILLLLSVIGVGWREEGSRTLATWIYGFQIAVLVLLGCIGGSVILPLAVDITAVYCLWWTDGAHQWFAIEDRAPGWTRTWRQ